jgi:cation transport ATPase
MRYSGKVEFAQARKMRERNTRLYRLAHWPIWIWVFFLAPGPLTFSLFAHGFGRGNLAWLAAVLAGTGAAGLRGQLPGVEPRPYILRFDEDKPNPLYRRVCYTFAWNAALSFALLNLVGLTIAAASGVWYMKQLYHYAYFPLCAVILWVGMGGDSGANNAARALESIATDTSYEPREVDRVSGRAGIHGTGGLSWRASAHTPHSSWRIDDCGLASAIWTAPRF